MVGGEEKEGGVTSLGKGVLGRVGWEGLGGRRETLDRPCVWGQTPLHFYHGYRAFSA